MEARLARGISGFLEAAAAACLLTLMLMDLVDVLGRNLLNRPLPWSTEVLEIVVAAMVFLLYPVIALAGGHITVDLIKVSRATHRLQILVGSIAGAVLFGVIAWCLGRQAVRSQGYGEASPILGIPTWMVLASMTVLAIATLLACLWALVHAATHAPGDTGVISATPTLVSPASPLPPQEVA